MELTVNVPFIVGAVVSAVAVTVYVIALGFVNDPLFATLIVFGPVLTAVYVKVADGLAVVKLTVAGLNVPLAPPSDGVTVTAEATVPPVGDRATVKFEDAVFTTPEVGPVNVNAVAAGGATPAVSFPLPSNAHSASRFGACVLVAVVGGV
jgi:hypothetical protein